MSPATATEPKSVSLVNISTEKWPPRQRTYFGSLDVRSPQPGEPYAITPIRACKGVMDLGDKRVHEIHISAQEIAEDLARELNGDSGEGSFHGVFVAAGPQPTEAELADASRNFNTAWWPPRTSSGSAPRIPCSSPTSNAAPPASSASKSPGYTIPSPWPNAPRAPKRSSPASRSAALAAPSSTKKKPRNTAYSLQRKRAAKDPKPP